jgi:hypothetical protein
MDESRPGDMRENYLCSIRRRVMKVKRCFIWIKEPARFIIISKVLLFNSIFLLFAYWPTNSAAQSAEDVESAFPLSKGNYWIYKGIVKWTGVIDTLDTIGELEDTLIWKMEVLDFVDRDHVKGYVVKGHPILLAWYSPNKERNVVYIIQVGAGKYYWGNEEDLNRLRDQEDNLGELVSAGNLFLDLPLELGKVFGETEQITRLDYSYSWHVVNAEEVKLENVKGIPPLDGIEQYTLLYQTLSERQAFQFVPYVGITKFGYVHWGTVAECDVELLEFFSKEGVDHLGKSHSELRKEEGRRE